MLNVVKNLNRRLKRTVKYFTLSAQERRHSLVGPYAIWEQKRSFQFSFLKNHGLQPHHILLDLGCGTLRGGIPLIDYLNPGHYYGLEISPKRLKLAKKELFYAKLTHKEPILVSDACKLTTTFDLVLAFAVFDHLTDDILENYFATIKVKPGGVIYADANIGDKVARWREYPVISRSLDQYHSLASKYHYRMEELGTLQSLGDTSHTHTSRRMMAFHFEPQ